MRIENRSVLRSILRLKGYFAKGNVPALRRFSGIEIAPFKHNARAAVCISSDFELSWAWRGHSQEVMDHRAITERKNTPLVLRLLEEYSIPVTWATVGHLFLETCRPSSSGMAHPEMPRPLRNERFTGDWYRHDPCSNVQKDPLWYAPDLIHRICGCRTPQELGTHSFSHVNFSERSSASELVRAEIEACREVMEPFGARPRSLVFPHNIMGYSYLPLLAELGIVAIRHRDERVALAYPERTATGVYKLYESMHLRIADHYDSFEKGKILIQEAMKRQAAYCLWFHPSDPSKVFDDPFRRMLEYMDGERQAGRLWFATMGDLAAYCEARGQTTLRVDRSNDALTIHVESSLDISRYGTPEVTLVIPASALPKSAWQELADGRQVPIPSYWSNPNGAASFMVNVPPTARRLRFVF